MRPNVEVLDSRATSIGVLTLCHRKPSERPGMVVTEILIDGTMLMSSLSTISEEVLSTAGLRLHRGGAGLAVLVGGLGLGYTAHAALADPRVARVTVVDRMPVVIEWMRAGRVPLAGELNADERLEIREGDVYAELLGPGRGQYDVILIDVDHAPTAPLDPASEPFYTWQGQRQVADHLKPGGVLAVWSAEDDDDFADVLAEVYPESEREHVRWSHELIADGEEVAEVIFLGRHA